MNLAISTTNLYLFNFQESVIKDEQVNLRCISTNDKLPMNEIRECTIDETNNFRVVIVSIEWLH